MLAIAHESSALPDRRSNLAAADDLGAVLALITVDTTNTRHREDLLDVILVPRRGALRVFMKEETALLDLAHVQLKDESRMDANLRELLGGQLWVSSEITDSSP